MSCVWFTITRLNKTKGTLPHEEDELAEAIYKRRLQGRTWQKANQLKMPLPTRLAYVLQPITQARLGATSIGSALRGRQKTVVADQGCNAKQTSMPMPRMVFMMWLRNSRSYRDSAGLPLQEVAVKTFLSQRLSKLINLFCKVLVMVPPVVVICKWQ